MWRNESRYKQGVKEPIFAYQSAGLDLEEAKKKAIKLLKHSLDEHAEQVAQADQNGAD